MYKENSKSPRVGMKTSWCGEKITKTHESIYDGSTLKNNNNKIIKVRLRYILKQKPKTITLDFQSTLIFWLINPLSLR